MRRRNEQNGLFLSGRKGSGGEMSASHWYVIRTTPSGEYLSAAQLERDGYEVFLPRFRAPVPRPSHDDAPLFPGYLFIRVNFEVDGWPNFRPAHRVSGWVRTGNEVPVVPDQVMDVLMSDLCSLEGEQSFWRRYFPGEQVNIVSKSLNGSAVVLEESRSPESRVKVMLEFMGRMINAQVPWDNIRPSNGINQEIPRATKAPRRTRGRNRWIQGHEPRLAPSN
jgi:transcriptional antiterminator RfaH